MKLVIVTESLRQPEMFRGAMVVVVAATILCGCSRNRRPSERSAGEAISDGGGVPTTQLSGRPFVTQGLVEPMAMAVIDRRLVVADKTGSDSMIKVFDLETGRLVLATGRVGSGPGEFQSIWAVGRSRRPSSPSSAASVFDFALRRVTEIDLTEAGRSTHPRDRPLVVLQPEATLTSALWVNDTTLVSLGFFRHGRLGLFDTSGRETGFIGEVPGDTTSIPASVLQHAYQGALALEPNGSKAVVVDRHAGRVELIAIGGGAVQVVRGPVYFEPKFEVARGQDSARTPVFASGEKLRFGYVSVAVTNDRIVALFSGRVRGEYPGEANYGKVIHEFDWNGVFLRAYDLKEAAFSIAVDAASNRLFAARHDPEPSITEYQLPETK